MKSIKKQSCFANDRLRVSITDTCNLNCSYCSNEGQDHNNKKYLGLATYRTFLSKIKKEQIYIRKLNITGGEPLLHPDLSTILIESVDIADEVTVNTNGLFLSKDIIKRFHVIGIKNIKFGIDWIFGDMIKPSKNKPEFNRAKYIENLMYAIELMPRSSLNVVISEFNATRIEAMFDFVVENKIDKVEFLEMIEHKFRKNGVLPRRVISAKDLVAKFADRFIRIEYNEQLAKYICFLKDDLMVQFAEDFCRRGVCQNLWTRIDTDCNISPCIKNSNSYSLDMEALIAPQIRKLNAMMCNSANDNFPWTWSDALRSGKGDDCGIDNQIYKLDTESVIVHNSKLDP